MDVLMEERFKIQYYKFNPSFSHYTFMKKIPKDTFIYRSGVNEISETRATRFKAAGNKLNPVFLKKPKAKEGVFFHIFQTFLVHLIRQHYMDQIIIPNYINGN